MDHDWTLKKDRKFIYFSRKKEARKVKEDSRKARSLTGLKAKLYNK